MRPILLGISNPHSPHPDDALSTRPINASGYRLYIMIKEAANRQGRDFSEGDYMEGFDRRNLFTPENMVNGKLIVSKALSSLARRMVVMLGQKVPNHLGIKDITFSNNAKNVGYFRYHVIPHPSGLCRSYNDPEVREQVGNLLYRLYREG